MALGLMRAFWALGEDHGLPRLDGSGRGNTLNSSTCPAVDTAALFGIGRNPNDGSQGFTGGTRAVGITNQPLTSGDSDTLYNGGAAAMLWGSLPGTLQAKFDAWWDLDALSGGTTAIDLTGNGSTLTLGGHPPGGVAGPGGAGSAVHWDGSGQVSCVSNAHVSFGRRYRRVVGWVNLDAAGAAGAYAWLSKWARGTSACPECVLYAHSDGANAQWWGDIGNGSQSLVNNVVVSYGANLTPGSWDFVEYEYDPAANTWTLTVNRDLGSAVSVSPVAIPARRPAIMIAGGNSAAYSAVPSDLAGEHYSYTAGAPADLSMAAGDKTLLGWLQRDPSSANQILFGDLDLAGNLCTVCLQWVGDTLYWLVGNDAGGLCYASVPLADLLPHFFVATLNRTAGTVDLDLDHGTHLDSQPLTLSPPAPTRPYLLGACASGGGTARQWFGAVQGWAFFDGAPSSADKDYWFDGGRGRLLPPAGGAAPRGAAILGQL